MIAGFSGIPDQIGLTSGMPNSSEISKSRSGVKSWFGKLRNCFSSRRLWIRSTVVGFNEFEKSKPWISRPSFMPNGLIESRVPSASLSSRVLMTRDLSGLQPLTFVFGIAY
jgi:hypothetical protein